MTDIGHCLCTQLHCNVHMTKPQCAHDNGCTTQMLKNVPVALCVACPNGSCIQDTVVTLCSCSQHFRVNSILLVAGIQSGI